MHGASNVDFAGRSLDEFERPRPAWPPPPVAGTVSLWGTVIEHERGWRGRFAYPSRLLLVCAMCAWFEPGPGRPVVVHAFARRLYTLCELHRGGIEVPDGRRAKKTGLDPDELSNRANMPARECLAAVSSLEILGLVECLLTGEVRRR